MQHLGQFAIFIICLLEAFNMPALALQIIQPRSILAESHNATFACAYNNTGEGPLEEFRISVHKGEIGRDTEVCAFFFNTTINYLETTMALHCQGWSRNGSVSITISEINTSQSDLYICQIEKMHPPPYIKSNGNGTWIFISPNTTEIKRCGQFTQTTLIVLAFTAIFILYSVFITCLHWMLKKNQEEQSNEYVNMEPPKLSSGRRRGNHIGYRT
ncbi:T-cell-specific surface glycoprotein CD28 homolog [Scyliorhinus canicula]|uniref:T-cell-specific surface glycoprotein CD28 homolog n=1 Tax=Scyliorhinus canicula TaxID=7830 RepID=UPI0018F6C44E|nr:T-cell-specific surface glycoprotein CD28 homolog [Scyliorhinus canicula]